MPAWLLGFSCHGCAGFVPVDPYVGGAVDYVSIRVR